MDFRRLEPKDLAGFFANRLRALQTSPLAFLTTYEEEVASGSGHFANTLSHSGNDKAIFGAVLSDVIVGSLGVYRGDRKKIRHKATIWGMYVDPAHRGRSVGGALLDLAIGFAKNNMVVDAVHLSVESSNRGARSLYESRGFKCWGTEPRALCDGDAFYDDVHMVLLLR